MTWKYWWFRINGISSVVLVTIVLTTCGGSSSKSPPANGANAPILLFNGTGASPNDVAAVEAILKNNHLSYSTAKSSQLNQMDQSQIRQYCLLIVPGGNVVKSVTA